MKNVIITILAILVLVLGGYLVYDKFIVNEETTNSDGVTDSLQSQTPYSLKKGSRFQELYGDNLTVYIDKGQVYLAYNENYTGDKLNEIVSKTKKYKMEAYEIPEPQFEGIECYKVEQLNNVVAGYVTYTGNSGDVHFAFVLDDGRVSLINEGELIYKNVLNIQTSTSLKNIVTIVQSIVFSAYESYAIDINGNEFSFETAFNLEY